MACEADLTGVKITDESTAPSPVPAGPALVRLCDCGAKNPANARKCSACDEDISDVTPVPDAPDAPEAAFVLGALDGQYAYEVTQPSAVLGRAGDMGDYLAGKKYVSRSHATLEREGDKLFITNMSGTNFTFVNNKRITGRTRLQESNEIGLGGLELQGERQENAAYFIVRIGPCM